MFPRRNMQKHTWTFPDGQIRNPTYHILIERRWHSNVLDVLSFKVAYFDTDH